MDLSMPVMDGFEATRQLASAARAPAVLVLTGSDSPADVARARAAGAAAYLTKDHIADDLVRAIFAAAGVRSATLPACSRSSRSSTS
jgi:DNA-binding NarL/FixJ family response regulator